MTSTMLESSDGTAIHTVHSPATDKSKAHVLICHGANEHIGRYPHVIEALNAAGYTVTGMDLRGHGQSSGKRGHVLRWEHYSEDIRVVAQSVNAPIFLLGHSMGGLSMLEVLREGINGVDVKGVMVSNPLLALSFTPPRIKTAFARMLSVTTPGLLLDNELNPDHLSRDAEMNAAYVADPLVTSKLSPRWFTEMKLATQRVQGAAKSYTAPLLLMQGSADPITCVDTAREFYEQYTGPKTLQSHQDLYHEIFNELEREDVIAQMITWLDEQVAGTQ